MGGAGDKRIMHSLPLFLSLQGRPVILIGEGPAADAKRRLIERAGAIPVGEDDCTARIAFVACEEPREGEAIAARLKARGVLVNVVDRPALCDFTTPAIVDRDPVIVAIGTGGRSAGLGKMLRQRLETLLPAGLGRLADALYEAREAIRHRWPAPDDRRRAIDTGLAEGGPIDPFRDGAAASVSHWLTAEVDEVGDRLVRIRLRSDHPDDLTLREARLLGQADRIFHRADIAPAILHRARADAERVACDAPPPAPGPGLSLDLERVR